MNIERFARFAVAALAGSLFAVRGAAQAPRPDAKTLAATGILERLAERTGVWGVPATAKVPGFIADASWPQKLPNNWIIGQVGGLYVAPDDHIWVYQRPRSLTNDEAAQTDATNKDKDGKPVDVFGFQRPLGPAAYCCKPAPSVLEFDANGKLLRAWGGPADPEKCKESEGCVWPATEHGIFVDHNGFVYVAGNNASATGNGSAWAGTHGSDGMILKFTKDGKFVMMIGAPGAKGPDSNNKDGGRNGTPQFYLPADITVDPATNRMFVSDGYGNRRDKAAADAGPWMNDYTKGNLRPAFFRNPVHCVKLSKDGFLYVCDRGNDRIQVFRAGDPALGKPCSNPSGEAGKCGFVKEQFVAIKTATQPVLPGSAVSMNFSTDPRQSCLYVGDNTNQMIYILERDTLQELGRLGRSGREAGEFHWLHQVAVDSHGNLYTGEVDSGKRLQRFVRFGSEGCSGTGRATVGELLP